MTTVAEGWTPSAKTRVLDRVRRMPRGAMIGLVVITVWVVIAAFPSAFVSADPNHIEIDSAFQSPSTSRPFGTDWFGRDMAARMFHGARFSLVVAVGAVLLGTGSGAALGLFFGFVGGIADTIAQRFVDIMMALPTLILAIAIVAALGPSLTNTVIAVSFPMVARTSRVVRSQTIQIKQQPYIEAARSVGANTTRIIIRHVLPNAVSAVLVLATLSIGIAILTESALGFIGLGVPPPTPTWGAMIADGRPYIEKAPWISIFPGAAITVAVLAANLVGDATTDFVDSRGRVGKKRTQGPDS